jgi:sugar (pentulose or hexulose) kinase
MNVPEAGSLGAALLGGAAVGIYADLRDAAARATRARSNVEPDEQMSETYGRLRSKLNDRYRRLAQ